MGLGSGDLVTVGTLDRGSHLALEYLEYGCTDNVDHSDQQFMSIRWFSFRVADKMRDLLNKGSRDIAMPGSCISLIQCMSFSCVVVGLLVDF